ncbi:MAG: RagB/SusD family nutrient uptake outer membrane protein, partial [Chitinophagaceae bacterium]|nr:RagB/SusD family nutrient uptake outer membrane protein [Chitinophagaceae bacterium]
VFGNDRSADAAATDIYCEMMKSLDYPNGYISRFLGQYGDEIQRTSTSIPEPDAPWYKCIVKPSDKILLSFWSRPYSFIYECNNIIGQLENNDQVSAGVRSRLIGEAKFLRAFHYFYLINLFGDVPCITETDFRKNADKARSFKLVIYQQVLADLEAATKLLPAPGSTSDSSINLGKRAGKWAAMALQARAYLYCEEWEKAEQAASAIIDSGNYILEPSLNNVFLIKS